MNNDRNAIPKPMHVQVQDLTVALDKALKDVKIRDEALRKADDEIDFLRANVEHLRDQRDGAYRVRDVVRNERDKVLADFIGLNKRVNVLEMRIGLEDRPMPFRIPQDEAPEQDPFADVPPAPQRLRPGQAGRLNMQNMQAPRAQLAEQAIQAGVNRMRQVAAQVDMERIAQLERHVNERPNPWLGAPRARPLPAQWIVDNVAPVIEFDIEQAPEVGLPEPDDNF